MIMEFLSINIMHHFYHQRIMKMYLPDQNIIPEEADGLGNMPPAAPAHLPLFRLGRWTAGSGGDGNLEDVSHLPGHQVEANLIKDVWIRQE